MLTVGDTTIEEAVEITFVPSNQEYGPGPFTDNVRLSPTHIVGLPEIPTVGPVIVVIPVCVQVVQPAESSAVTVYPLNPIAVGVTTTDWAVEFMFCQ